MNNLNTLALQFGFDFTHTDLKEFAAANAHDFSRFVSPILTHMHDYGGSKFIVPIMQEFIHVARTQARKDKIVGKVGSQRPVSMVIIRSPNSAHPARYYHRASQIYRQGKTSFDFLPFALILKSFDVEVRTIFNTGYVMKPDANTGYKMHRVHIPPANALKQAISGLRELSYGKLYTEYFQSLLGMEVGKQYRGQVLYNLSLMKKNDVLTLRFVPIRSIDDEVVVTLSGDGFKVKLLQPGMPVEELPVDEDLIFEILQCVKLERQPQRRK